MGSIGRRTQRTRQGTHRFLKISSTRINILQVNTHCYEAVDLDGLVRVSHYSTLSLIGTKAVSSSYPTSSSSLLLRSTTLARHTWFQMF